MTQGMIEEVETTTERTTEVEVDLGPGEVLRGVLDDLDFEVSFSGQKTSEGDGRTAADIEHEMAERDYWAAEAKRTEEGRDGAE